jgi:putative ubiquitin-RnfH superfamily antitoxin RatB of RatAB toxin-antitoxin module
MHSSRALGRSRELAMAEVAGGADAVIVSDKKRCTVAYATPERQYLWTVDLLADATIDDAIEAARQIAVEHAIPGGMTDRKSADGMSASVASKAAPDAPSVDVPWNTAPVGIFGELRDRQDVPADGDRVEIYRPLRSDPRERRRESVRRARKAKPP